jgi:hypothetical protein
MGGTFDAGELCTWFAHAWHDLAGDDDPNHLKWHLGLLGNRPCVEQVRDWQGVGNYAAKYLGKLSIGDEEWQHPGRFWGQRRADLAPITMVTHDVPQTAAVKLRRVLVKRYESLPSGWYYLPGRLMLHGKHRAGKRIHRKQLKRFVMGGEEGPLPEMLARISDDFEALIRPQKRRWKGRIGGWSGFIMAATFERLMAWAGFDVACPIPPPPVASTAPAVVPPGLATASPRAAPLHMKLLPQPSIEEVEGATETGDAVGSIDGHEAEA